VCARAWSTPLQLGVMYLEHEAIPGVFTVDHVHLVRVLASQLAISMRNLRLLEEARLHRLASLRFVPQQVHAVCVRAFHALVSGTWSVRHAHGRPSAAGRVGDVHVHRAVLERARIHTTGRERGIATYVQAAQHATSWCVCCAVRSCGHCVRADIGPVVRRYSGFIDNFVGDALLCIFPHDATSAVLAAIDIQEAVAAFNVAHLPTALSDGETAPRRAPDLSDDDELQKEMRDSSVADDDTAAAAVTAADREDSDSLANVNRAGVNAAQMTRLSAASTSTSVSETSIRSAGRNAAAARTAAAVVALSVSAVADTVALKSSADKLALPSSRRSSNGSSTESVALTNEPASSAVLSTVTSGSTSVRLGISSPLDDAQMSRRGVSEIASAPLPAPSPIFANRRRSWTVLPSLSAATTTRADAPARDAVTLPSGSPRRPSTTAPVVDAMPTGSPRQQPRRASDAALSASRSASPQPVPIESGVAANVYQARRLCNVWRACSYARTANITYAPAAADRAGAHWHWHRSGRRRHGCCRRGACGGVVNDVR
jgi:hypothetical protein